LQHDAVCNLNRKHGLLYLQQSYDNKLCFQNSTITGDTYCLAPLPINNKGLDRSLPKKVHTPKILRLLIRISNKLNIIAYHVVNTT